MTRHRLPKREPAVAMPYAAEVGEVIEMVPKMIRLQTILVPTDFAKPSEKALRYALSFARQFDGKIVLLHVCRPSCVDDIRDRASTEPAREESAEERSQLDSIAATIPPDLLGQSLLRVGIPFHEISKAAKELDADLIIISTLGKSGLRHVLLGSTAERVVRHAPCPVLVVRELEHEFV